MRECLFLFFLASREHDALSSRHPDAYKTRLLQGEISSGDDADSAEAPADAPRAGASFADFSPAFDLRSNEILQARRDDQPKALLSISDTLSKVL
jgi:hypothetical protein